MPDHDHTAEEFDELYPSLVPSRTMDYRMSMMTNVMAYCSRASSWPRGCEKSHSSKGDARGHFKVRYSANLTPGNEL